MLRKPIAWLCVILFSQKKLQEALEKLREKQLEAEELEVKVRADIAAWKVGEGTSWGI